MVEDTRVVIVEGVAEVVATCFIDKLVTYHATRAMASSFTKRIMVLFWQGTLSGGGVKIWQTAIEQRRALHLHLLAKADTLDQVARAGSVFC